MSDRTEVRVGVTWSDSGWCWLDSRFLYTGTQLWVREINERGGMFVPEEGRRLPVRLVQYDDRSDPETQIEVVTRMCERDRIDVFCSSGAAEMQNEALEITERHRVLNLNVGAPDQQLFQQGHRHHLQCGPSLHGATRSRPPFWKQHGLTRIAQIHADFWGWNGAGAPLEGFIEEEGGLDLVLHEAVPRQEKWSTAFGPYARDFDGWGAIVDRLVEARPDAVMIYLPAPAEYMIMRELRRRGVWFRYLELMYNLNLSRIGFGPEDLLYLFHGGRVFEGPHPEEINVGGTQEALDQLAAAKMPGVERRVYGRSYVGLALWEHLVRLAGSMDADAVMAQAHKESGTIVTMLGRLTWKPTGDTEEIDGVTLGVSQIQRHPWTAELQSVLVGPDEIARAQPIFTDEPYERRPPPWSGSSS